MDSAMMQASQAVAAEIQGVPDDAEALRRCQAGDISGLGALAARHQLAALRIAYLLVQDQALAEDIVQEGFLLAYRHAAQVRSGALFAPWFHRIVLNAARQHLRAAARRRETSLDQLDARSAGRMPVASDPLRHAERTELRAAVMHVLRALTHKQREVLVLRYYGGYKDGEIARALRCPAGTVRWRLHAALRAFDRHARTSYPWLLEEGRGPTAMLAQIEREAAE
jgi:RNA polymerase sigma-70 factor (ECF subfamily)